jgi:D-beta-D-heptose 7-phosphate kinase / D-beta-D-heptose 1-phosphate adenosyltransferase
MYKDKIITFKKIKSTITSIRKNGKSIALCGGCFDIIHIGHVKFLIEAKKIADILIILLESDQRVKKNKGETRPYFHQKERAYLLSSLQAVDYIITLPYFKNDFDYNNLISEIAPDFIVATSNDPILKKKMVQAKNTSAKLHVIPFIKTFSSSELAKIIGVD